MNISEIQRSIESGKLPDAPGPKPQNKDYLAWLEMPQTKVMLETLTTKRQSLLEAAEGSRDNPTTSRALLEQASTIKEVMRIIGNLIYA